MHKVLHAYRHSMAPTAAATARPGGRVLPLLLITFLCGAGLPAAAAAQVGVKAKTGVATQSDSTAQGSTRPEDESIARDRTEDVQRAVDRIFDEPLSGVVVNRTVTVLGKDFYRYFSNYWRVHSESSRYSISIHERPTARFGSEIWVLYRQQRMFHTFLPPARQATRDISEIAVQLVLENIQRRELERLTTRNPDLGPEEL